MGKLRVYVVGRIGRPGQTERIEFLVSGLKEAGFEVTSCLDQPKYEDKDWRDDFEGAQRQKENLEKFLENNKFDVIAADLSAASDGRSYEQFLARRYDIPVYGYAPVRVTTPTRLYEVDELFVTLDSFILALRMLKIELELEREKSKEIEEKRNRNFFYRIWGNVWLSNLITTVLGMILLVGGATATILTNNATFVFIGLPGLIILLVLIKATFTHRRYIRIMNS